MAFSSVNAHGHLSYHHHTHDYPSLYTNTSIVYSFNTTYHYKYSYIEECKHKYWCKAMGSHAYDDDKKDDHIHLLMRTPWFILHIVTCLMIITGNGRLLGWW